MARRNRITVPEAKRSMDQFKTLWEGDNNGDLTSREAGSVGGEMVRRMIRYAENDMSDR